MDHSRWTAALALSLIVAVAAGTAAAQTSLPRPAVTPSPDDLLAALDWHVLQEVAGGPQWWPHFPQFNVGIGDRAPALNFYVIQQLTRMGGPPRESLESTALVYANAAAAREDFQGRLLRQNDRGATQVAGPSVGAASRYFTRQLSSGELRDETAMRFVTGPFVSRVSLFAAAGGDQAALAARVARLRQVGEVVEQRLRAVQEGRLRAAPVPARIAQMLPPASVAAPIGRVYGTAVLSPHAWALVDTSGKPEQTLAALRRGGVDELTLRRYGLQADPTHVVEVTYMFFATPEHAAQWVSAFLAEARQHAALDHGKTGRLAAFARYPDGAYELQFAKGQVVGDVFCTAPFGKTTSACERAVRALAEGWYAALPGPR